MLEGMARKDKREKSILKGPPKIFKVESSSGLFVMKIHFLVL